ncbi:GDSL-type esterase/lipase family protein, partial [Pseudomonadota bacterium]
LKIDRPDGVKGIEVINGGLPLGSTAELVTHYLYKYRYYRPDIVIINTGGNDAYPRILDNFHPDYSHWKQPMNVPRPASNFGQILFSSRLAALLTIPIFYDIRSVDYTVKRVGSEPPVQWYDRGDREVGIAFRSNLETLVREIKADGAKVYLMPFRMRPKNAYPPELRVAILDNERILKQTATKFAVDIIPFPEEIISPMNWRDNCHLNAAGSLQKAQQISLKVRADVINFIR